MASTTPRIYQFFASIARKRANHKVIYFLPAIVFDIEGDVSFKKFYRVSCFSINIRRFHDYFLKYIKILSLSFLDFLLCDKNLNF